jgi:hypothetical protein
MAISHSTLSLGNHAPPCLQTAFFMGPRRLHGNFGGCAIGHKLWGDGPFQCTKARFDRGIALASAESTAATLLGLLFSKSGSSANKQDLGLAKAFWPFLCRWPSGRRIKLSYPLLASAGRLCSLERTLGTSAVLCKLKPAVACKGYHNQKTGAQFVTVEQISALKRVHNMHLHPEGIR